MSYYVACYDTEAVYPWWELQHQPYSARLYRESVRYEGEPLEECLRGIRAVAEVHEKHHLPATFFLVGELVSRAARELRGILDRPLFDLQCHSWSHEDLTAIADDRNALQREIVDSKNLIEDTFGRAVTGFTTPGAFTGGLVGQKRQLELLARAGYRFIRSAGKGPSGTVPAPLTQPFWYTRDGFPQLLELGLHGWHDNILCGQPFPVHWPPIFPWGYPARVPATVREMVAVYAPFLEQVRERNLLTYVPCFHPWSIYRFDAAASHIERLLAQARRAMTIVSCVVIDRIIRRERSLAAESPPA